MNGCCSTLRAGHDVDWAVVERAVQGQTVQLTRNERKVVIWRLANRRGWGLDKISAHVGYSRTKVAEVLQDARGNR